MSPGCRGEAVPPVGQRGSASPKLAPSVAFHFTHARQRLRIAHTRQVRVGVPVAKLRLGVSRLLGLAALDLLTAYGQVGSQPFGCFLAPVGHLGRAERIAALAATGPRGRSGREVPRALAQVASARRIFGESLS
jgi:hypothetical protein